jgi:carboxyl-terminal processing protease
MENKKTRTILILFTIFIFIAGSFSAGLWLGFRLSTRSASTYTEQSAETSNSQQATSTPVDTQTLFKPFWQAWDLVHQDYYQQPVDDTLLMQGAIRGMMDSLGDPHSSYLDPDELQQANMPLEGSYEGIGAWVDTTQDYLTIISPMPGTPAERAGLKAGDEIIAVDGKDMTAIDPSIVLRSVLGPAGTDVTLTILRKDADEPFDVTLTREKITLQSVAGKMLENNIAYIQLSTFGDTTIDDLHAKLKELLANQPIGLILDLRNNGGGYLDTAVAVISEFISSGTALIEEYGDGTQITHSIDPGGLATNIKLVVLVNEGSASASEITAGAIQDYDRGILIGTVTYGKGSVQQWIDLVNNQGAVRITVAHWLTPNGRQINGVGLTPDITVPMTQDDVDNNLDPQLDRAVQYLLTGQ